MSYFRDLFYFDKFSLVIAGFLLFFTLLTVFYSLAFMRRSKRKGAYYFYILLTFIASLGAVFSNNLILFMVFWGFLGLLLYLLIGFGTKQNTSATAKKAFIIVGAADVVMLLGLAFFWNITRSLQMQGLSVVLDSPLAVWSYLCFAAGAFAKAGAMPFHTWVPDVAEDAPIPVTAFLPASLDKLLGIYFLVRLSLTMFAMDTGMNTFLMVVGSITIVAAVMMALIQHDLKRLLGYHAVSQVGYMVLGIGTGNPVGIAGGLFHMLNNTIYKSCLFFSGGAVEKDAGTTDLRKLGGFAKVMPITFVSFLIASFAISGVPPFNGFVSKWMVYQGIIETARAGGGMWVVWLVCAMFGSALTLASFMKLLHAVFLGQPALEQLPRGPQVRKAPLAMVIPMIILASLCVIFGVFASKVPLSLFVIPSLGLDIVFSGTWMAGAATLLLLVGILIGLAIYFLGAITKVRQVDTFIGGENLKKYPEMRVSGAEFYNTVSEVGILRLMYGLAKRKVFDVYEVGSKITFVFNAILRYLHNGVLSTYLTWCLLGMGVLLYLLLR